MYKASRFFSYIAGLIVALLVLAPAAAPRLLAQTPNDTARFLAGLEPSAGSPLSAATQGAWQGHAREMNRSWAGFEKGIAARIQVWAIAKLPPSPPSMLYMFGGPDFPHANAFYPDASVYVLSGLEPVRIVPDATKLSASKLAGSLASLRRSLDYYLTHGYFITSHMTTNLRAGDFTGTVPLLYLFLARSGKTINQVEFVELGAGGTTVPAKGKQKPGGVKITFTGADGKPSTLYYFSTDLSNGGVAKSTFLAFCEKQGTAGSLLKSASYILHNQGFSKVRDFLLKHSAVIVQDDTGIPLRYYARGGWRLRAFGAYVPPIPVFKNNYQADMAELFSGRIERLNFRMGYHSNASRTNILVAEKARAVSQ